MRAGIALVVLTAWFGTLLVAAPTTPHASAAGPADPTITSGPSGPGHDPTPTWTITVPADTITPQEPVYELLPAGGGATSTATIAVTHAPVCAIDSDGSPRFDACTATGAPGAGTFSFTRSSELSPTAGTDYTFSAQDVVTTTTTTTVVDDNGDPLPPPDPDITTDNSGVVTRSYHFDSVAPTVDLTSSPPVTGPTDTVGWVFTADGSEPVTCVLSGTSSSGPAPCGTGDVFPGGPLGDGDYTITATATDEAGNTGNTDTTPTTYHQDTTAPTLTLVHGPTGRGKDTTPGWLLHASGDVRVDCSLTLNGNPVDVLDPRCDLADYPATALTDDGTYVLTATAEDADHNRRTEVMATYVLDTTAPDITIGAVDASTPNRPSWSVDVSDAESGLIAQCHLTGTSGFDLTPSACGPTFVAPALAEGTYTLSVSVTDSAGNPATVDSPPYTYDITDPRAPVLGGTSGYIRSGPISWTVAKSPLDSDINHLVCVVTPPTGPATTTNPCPSLPPIVLQASDEGLWRLSVTAVDNSGHTGPAATRSVTYDHTLAAPVVTGPTGSAKHPVWHVTVDSDATATCSMAGVTLTPTACDGQDVEADLTTKPGAVYTLVVNAVDAAGNTASTSVDYVLAPDAPTVSVATQGRSLNPAWTISAQADAALTCTLIPPSGPGIAVSSCSAGTITPDLTGGANGRWNLEVVATIATATHGMVSSSVGTTVDGYLLDTIGPGAPTIAGTPSRTQKTSTASWTVTPATGTTRVDCDVFHDGLLARTVTPCTGVSLTFGTTSDEGDWQVKATAYDQVDNPSTVVPGPIVVFDMTPPAAPDIQPLPSPSNNPSPTWTINHEVGTSLECAWTTGNAVPASWFACDSPDVIAVPGAQDDGVYTLHARATDQAGNTGPAGSRDYELDRTPPPLPTFSTPATPNSSAAVSWTIGTGTEVSPTIECRLLTDDGTGNFVLLTGHDWAPCSSSLAVTLPVEGGYRAQARITDRAGTLGPVGTSITYVYDKTPPHVPVVDGPTGPSQTDSVTWTITRAATDGGTELQCRFVENGAEVGSFTSCGTTVTRTGLADGSYAVEVQALDDAGNVSTPFVPSPTYVVDTDGPAAPTFAGSDGTSNVRSTSWSFTGESGATARCRLYHNGVALGSGPSACDSGDTFPLNAGEGSYRLEVFFVDAAGNDGIAALSPTYLLDTLPPARPVLHGPTGVANTTTASYVFTAEAASVAQCRLLFVDAGSLGAPAPVDPGAWSPCTSPWDVSLVLGDGRYQAEVHVTDAAGNISLDAQSEVYELDTTGPLAVTFTTEPTGTDNDPAVTWDWSGEKPSTGTCTLRHTPVGGTTAAIVAGPIACNSETFAATLSAGDGFYQLFVQLTDPQHNAGAITPSTGYTLDMTAPTAPTVTGPGGTSNDTAAHYAISSVVESGATAECKLTRDATTVVEDWVPCSLPRTITLSGDGSYVLEVRLTDQYGNLGPAGASPAFLLDTEPPALPDLHGPTGVANTRDVRYDFTAETASAAECQLLFVAVGSPGLPQPVVPGGWTRCTSPWNVTLAQGDGHYQAEVRVTDRAGNVSPVAQSEDYELDTTGPLAPTFTAQPTGTANRKDVTWDWSGEMPSTGVCRLLFTPTGGAGASVVAGPSACDSQTYRTTLSSGDGLYQLTVRLTDPSHNAGALATSTSYTLDTTPPGAPAVSGPNGTSNRSTVDYAITSVVEPLATAECRLNRDGAVVNDWATCTMPRSIPLVGDGSYVLEVRLTDQYGNMGAVGASPAYLLDTKPPTVPVVTAPASPSANGAPVFTFVTDGDTRTTCRVVRGSVVAVDTTLCAGSFTASLSGQPDGDYALSVTATDPAGNTSTGSSAAYTYDTTKPIAPVVTGPAGPSQQRNPVFSWTGEVGARPECSLQEKAGSPTGWTPCANPYPPTLPSDGSWVLSVRLVDAAGNVGDPGQSGAYLLDTTAPPAPVVTAPPSPGRDLAPSWSAAIEEGSHTDCRLSGPGQVGGWAPCTLPRTTPISGDGTYTMEVRATDVADNTSLVGAATYILDTTAPVAPVVVQPTSPGRNRTPSVTFSSELGTTGSCKLTRGSTVLSDAAACASPTTLNLTGLTDGAYTLTVRAVDTAGNIGPAGTATYVLDTTAPAVPTMTLVAGSPSSDRAPLFGFNADLGTTLSCKVTLPSGVVRDLTCTSPVVLDLSGATDGDYVLSIRATDVAGNVSAPATTTYQLDSNAPAAPKVVGPATPGNIRNPVWRISSTSPAECRLLRGGVVARDWAPCGTSYAADLFAQPDAVYVLEARAIGTTAATMSRYRLDTSGPAAATIVGPPTPSTDRKPTWAVSSPDTTVHAECRVMVFTGVLKDWAACGVSPAGSLYTLDLTGLGDGTYSLLVRLTDAAGNTGPVATSDYALDTSAPAAVGVIAPLSPDHDTTPTWTLTSAAGVKLECRLSSGQKVISDFAPCAGAFTADLSGWPDGTYTLTVHALSAAGTPGPETTSGYILDTTAASAPGTLAGPTGPSRNRAPKWTFTLAPGTTALCTVTFGGKVLRDEPCVSPFNLDLSNAPDGTYKLTVRAIDAAGNIGDPSSAIYILKTTPPPAPVLTMQPGSPSSTTDPTWGFSLSRGTTAQCRRLLAGTALEDWAPCGAAGASNGRASALLSGKPDGRYTMQIRAIDEAQNTSSAVGSDYVFDRSAAALAVFVDTPITPGFDTTPTWIISAPPADTTPATAPAGTAALVRAAALTGTPQTECRLTTPRGVGGWAPCSGSYVAKTDGDGTYLLEVRAFDTAGDRGPASSSSYLLDTKVPAAPRLVDPMPPAVGKAAEVVWSWADDGNLVQCHLLRNNAALGGFASCDLLFVANVGRLGEALYTVEARAVDAAGNVSPVTVDSYRYDITPPTAPAFTAKPPARGSASSVGWTFGLPVDTHAVCVVTRNGTVVSEGACAGAFTLDLRGQQPASWVLSVHLVDAAGNAGPATSGSYTLLSAIGRGRVSGPTVNGPAGGPDASGPEGGPGTNPAGGSQPSITGIDREQPRTGALHLPQVVKKTIKDVARAAAAIPGAVPGTDVPRAIKNVLGQTITKPQLPLALFVIVLLFLLVQNRIDRRDPKLAVAPATAEPELSFGPILRPGGATA